MLCLKRMPLLALQQVISSTRSNESAAKKDVSIVHRSTAGMLYASTVCFQNVFKEVQSGHTREQDRRHLRE